MANISGPFGFQRIGGVGPTSPFPVAGIGMGSPSSPSPYRIASGYSTAVYYGDAVRMNVSGPSGYVEQWANGDGGTATKILVGIFQGCQYFSTSRQTTWFSRYWPGSDATGDVTAYIDDDPLSQWMVQASAGPITMTAMGQTADIASSPTGNTATGISGMTLATPTTTNTLPFKVVGVMTQPPGVNGRDITTAFNIVAVTFNNQQYKALLGV